MNRVSSRSFRSRAASGWRVAGKTALAGVLLAGLSAPAANAEPSATADPVVIDAGNRITATVDPATSKVRLTTPTALIWDPNLTSMNLTPFVEGYDRFGYGAGWTFSSPGWPDGIRFINTNGGAEFYFPDLGRLYEIDASSETGLTWAYPRNDVRIGGWGEPQQLAGRGDVPARDAYWTLHQLETNTMEYYGAYGDLLATVNLTTNARWDWQYKTCEVFECDDHELRRVVDDQGNELFRIEELDSGYWNRFHQAGRTADVWTDGYYPEIVRIITPEARTEFTNVRSGAGKLPSITILFTPSFDGTNDVGVEIHWDTSRPGAVIRIQRCVAGVCHDAYPAP